MNFTLTSSDDELFFHTVGANDVVFLPWSISRVQQSDLGQGNGYHILVLPLRTICVFLLSDCLLLDVVLFLSLARVWNALPVDVTSAPSPKTFKTASLFTLFSYPGLVH